MADHRPLHVASLLLLLLLLAAVILALGINAPTGLTGKDEYLLGLRIPLEMMERDAWWIPFIDGEPRLKKPPFIYWLGRASYEIFGPSLAAARAVTVAFTLLLLGCAAWLGKKLGAGGTAGLMAAAVLLGMSGLASESRRFMLDIPVAALGTAAFCCYWAWLDQQRWSRLAACALLLSAALLTKGPVALIAFGSGIAALLLTRPELWRTVFRRWHHHLLLAGGAVALPAFWLIDVRQRYGQQFALAAEHELDARGLDFSPEILLGLITLALPWSFVALVALWRNRQRFEYRLLAAWILVSVAPFLLIRAFDRYLIAALVPLALACALSLRHQEVSAWTRRLGSLLPILLATTLALLLWRWEKDRTWMWLLPMLGYFVWAWWRRAASFVHLSLSAALLWSIGWGLAFPALGVNAIPARVFDLARDRRVVLFRGPQPALLPALSGRALRQTGKIEAQHLAPGTLLMARAEDIPALEEQLRAQPRQSAVSPAPSSVTLFEYRSLTSAGSGIRFARQGATLDDWRTAWLTRTPAPLESAIRILEIKP